MAPAGPYRPPAPLTEAELGRLLPGRPPDVVHAIWLSTFGRPGPARDLAGIAGDGADGDPVAALALRAPSRAEFLMPDVALIRLLETAAARPLPAAVRARVLIRLARELLGDPSSVARRRELVTEAVRLARAAADDGTLAEVLDGRLHALWDPAGARDRLDTGAEIVDRARRAGAAAVELRGLFWRFTALAELGDLGAAEAALVTYVRTGELVGDDAARAVGLSRQTVLALVRGRFDVAETLTVLLRDAGRDAGLADTERLAGMLTGFLAMLRGDAGAQVTPLRELALRLPGHFFEATAARALADAGRGAEARLELDRLLPAVLAGSGPRWLGAVADLAYVAAAGHAAPEAARRLYAALTPYRGRLVVWGGANMITGTVDDLLGRLAQRLGRPAEALAHLDRAVDQAERLGALPWLAAALAARQRPGDRERARDLRSRLGLGALPRPLDAGLPPIATAPAALDAGPAALDAPPPLLEAGLRALDADLPELATALATFDAGTADGEWRMSRDGDDWLIEAGAERVRLRDVRGLHYLRTLVSAPGREIAALDLVAGGAGLRVSPAAPVLDATARADYRRRLTVLDARLDAADRAGDPARADDVTRERAALVAALRAATGVGGRPRRQSAEAERARVNATRALRAVLARLEAVAPVAAAHLRASVRTGGRFRYEPAPGGPRRWRV